MVMGCIKCRKVCGIGLLVLGLAFLARDLGYWDFWGISWWTALLIWFGIGSMAMSKCAECVATIKKK